MRVTVVLPTLDEGPLLQQTVKEALSGLARHQVDFVIAAHSKLTTPQTRSAIKELKAAYGSSIDAFDQSRPGVGAALQEAFQRAQGEVVVLMTPDLETPPYALPALVEKIEQGYDMATATRWGKGIAFNGYPPVKLMCNFIFQQFFRALYLTRLSDLTFGYRAFKNPVVKHINWEEDRFPFFFETILKPLQLGLNIAQVSTPWSSFRTRKASIGRAPLSMLFSYIWLGLRVRLMSRARLWKE